MLSGIKNAVFTLIRSVFRLFSKDITHSLPPGPVLVVAPHPDDETLGCGAAIARLRDEGRTVRIVVVTDGRASSRSALITPDRLAAIRKEETLSAAQTLGVPPEQVAFLGYPDGEASAHLDAITRDLAREVAALAPAVVFSPSFYDNHPDHRAVAQAVARLQDEGKITGTVYQYPIWQIALNWSAELCRFVLSPWRYRRVRCIATKGSLERKESAIKRYQSQLERPTGEKKWEILGKDFVRRSLDGEELFFERLGAKEKP